MAALRVHTRPLEGCGPLLDELPAPGGVIWLQRAGGDEEGFVGWGVAARIDPGTGPERFAAARDGLAELLAGAEVVDEVGERGCGPVAFTSFTFDPATPGSTMLVPEVVIGRRRGRTWRTEVRRDAAPSPPTPARRPPAAHDRTRYAGASVPDVQWLDAVAAALERLRPGGLEKVVLARDHAVWSRTPFDDRVLAGRLAARFPECFTFHVDGLVGATPELLLRRVGDAVESLVLAGSAARGGDDHADALAGKALLGSEKDLAEHRFAVDSVRAGLTEVCTAVQTEPSPHLLRLDNVQHLATQITGQLAEPRHGLDVLAALHPTAAVCGTPTAQALATIRELEGMERGRYAGPVGWVDAHGDGEWGIALRCAELSGARARLFAGAGLVADSLPEAELEETRLKLRAMQSAFDG